MMKKKIVVTRVLERGVGSFFKINNKDVRARDVSVIFYDSGSGPRSSSIISQGNIDQIINFKPIDRRIILEDAAKFQDFKLEDMSRNLSYNLQNSI